MSQQKSREDVLFAFAVEPERNRLTLDRYLSTYPEFAEDLIDLANEIRLVEATTSNTTEVVEDEQHKSAWASFKAAGAVQPSPRCPHCGSTDLWDDNLAFGCRSCDRILGGN
jgi:hypothetical protein